LLQNEGYANTLRRRFVGEQKMSACFQMREDDVKPPSMVKEFVDEDPNKILGCLNAMAELRTCLVSEDGRMTANQMWLEAILGLQTKGSANDPIVVAIHVLHVEWYVDMVLCKIKGNGTQSVRFQMREDEVKEPVVLKECVSETEDELLDILGAIVNVRKLLLGNV